MTKLKVKTGARLDTMPPPDQLTPTEAKIWDLYTAGKSYQEMSDELGMAVKSVKRRLCDAKQKVFLK